MNKEYKGLEINLYITDKIKNENHILTKKMSCKLSGHLFYGTLYKILTKK